MPLRPNPVTFCHEIVKIGPRSSCCAALLTQNLTEPTFFAERERTTRGAYSDAAVHLQDACWWFPPQGREVPITRSDHYPVRLMVGDCGGG
jgi:hypothetical protein